MRNLTLLIMIGVIMLAVSVIAQYPTVTISEIQEVPVGQDSSSMTGDTVHVGGIVTGGTGLYYAGAGVTFYMEEAGGGPWSGIMAYNPTSEGFPTLIPGDSISVDALVSEYPYPYDPPFNSNMTELFIVPGSFQFHSFANPEPAPLPITADLIDTTGGGPGVSDSLGEQFEGVYVRVYEVTVDSLVVYSNTSTWVCHDTTGHEFMVREASDSISYLPTVGTEFAHVSGVVYHRFGVYSVQPRYMRDITFHSGAPIIGNVEYNPEHPFDDDPVVISANVFDDVEVAHVRLKYRINLSSWITVNMTEGQENIYSYTIPALPAGYRVDFYIEAEDNEANISKAPTEAPFNFFTYLILEPTEMTIAEAKVDANEDFVPDLRDSAAILNGIATSYNFATDRTDFYMQDGEAGITVIMFAEMANINIGDSIRATGVIDQYYGKTQLVVYDPDRLENLGGGHAIDTTVVTCAELGDGVGEEYEGMLVRVIGATIIEEPDSFPQIGSSATLTINDGTGNLLMRIDASTNIPGQNRPEGQQNIVGCLGQYSYSSPPDDDYQIMPRMYADFVDTVITSIDENDNLPRATSLEQNYPNPFNPSTSVSFYLAQAGDIEFTIYDVLGKRVYQLSQNDVAVGAHVINWHGTDLYGNSVASGIYFYRLKAGDFVDTKQMTLIK